MFGRRRVRGDEGSIIAKLRCTHGLKSRCEQLRAAGMLTFGEAAQPSPLTSEPSKCRRFTQPESMPESTKEVQCEA